MKDSIVKRKCEVCGEKGVSNKKNDKRNIFITRNNMNEHIYYNGSTYHKECFIKMCKEKAENAKRAPSKKKWEGALNDIDKIQEESRIVFEKAMIKEELNDFIIYHYNLLTNPSNYIYTQLDRIYEGTYKGLKMSIPIEDLFDMWKRQIVNLKSAHKKRASKGQEFDPEQKILYDMSVLVGKYHSYLKWKEECKVYEQNISSTTDNIVQPIDLDKLSKIAQSQSKNDDEDDIDSLLDELFD